MTDSLGRRLLRRIRSGAPSHQVDASSHAPPTLDELRAARDAVSRGGPTAAEAFLELVVAADRHGGGVRTVALHEITSSSPQGWLALDLASRRQWWAFPTWWRSAVDQAAKGESVLGVLVASFHPDGHVREAATARLAELGDIAVSPALAIRCGDWVAQVRDRARPAIEKRLEGDLVGTLESAGAVALLTSRRQTGNWLAATIQQHLRTSSAETIRAVARSSHALVRRSVLAIAVEQQRLDLLELVDLAAADSDLPARLTCGRAAINLAERTRNLDVLGRLLANPATQLRQAAMIALDRAGESRAPVELLADRARSVRDTAQRLVRSHGSDPADVYRPAVAERLPPVWAIAGLGETGSREDAHLIEPLLDDRRSRIRAEAVRALRRLDVVSLDRFTSLLSDSSPAVCKQAANALVPLASQLDSRHLWHLLRTGERTHTRVGAYRLLRARDAWTRLATNLELLGDESEELRMRARMDILGWLANEAASTYQAPTPELASELTRAIEARSEQLGRATTKALRFHVGVTAT